VVLNLAVWFGMQVLFSPRAGVNWFGVAVGLVSFIALQWTRLGIISVIFLSGGLGLAWHSVF
jgi:chromate transporter